MSKFKSVTTALSLSVLAATSVRAQFAEEYMVENQRTVEVETASWTNLYVGRYTSSNSLVMLPNSTLATENTYVGYSDSASSNSIQVSAGSWSSQNLTIGSDSNSNNIVIIDGGGVLDLQNVFTVNGVSNNNGLILADGGTLLIRSDFSAMHSGFTFGSGGTLKTTATLSDIDHVNDGRSLVFSGESAGWMRTTNHVTIGTATDNNKVTLEDGANIGFDLLTIGDAATVSNNLVVGNSSTVTVNSNLTVRGALNHLNIDGGTVAAMGALDSESEIKFSDDGVLTAYNMVTAQSIEGAGTFNLSGENAVWDNSGQMLTVGNVFPGSALILTNGALLKTQSIEIGGVSSAGNEVALGSGSKVILEGDGSVLHAGNSLKVDDGGWLVFASSSPFNTTITLNDSIEWNSGGTVEFRGDAPIINRWTKFIYQGSESNITGRIYENGALFVGEGRKLIISGPSGNWAASGENLHVGDISSGSSLVISNGASGTFNSASIGDFAEKGNDNNVLVSGAGSTMDSLSFTAIGGTLIGNEWHDGGMNNILRVEDQAVYTSQSLHNRNSTGSSGLEIASGATVNVGSYYQGANAFLTILTDNTGTNMGMLQATTAEFEAGARVGVDAISTILVDKQYTNTIASATTMIVGGVTNGTTADLAVLGQSGGSLLHYSLALTNGTDLVAMYSRRYLADVAGFNPDSIIAGVVNEIDRISMLTNEASYAQATNQINVLGNMSASQVKTELEQLYVYQLPTYMHNQGILRGIDEVRARGSSFHGTTKGSAMPQPIGAAGPGPHAADQGFQPWVKVYGAYGDRDKDGSSGFNDGYDVQAYGTVLGADKAYGKLLFGLAGGFAGSNLEGDNRDTSEATTAYGLLYASFGTEEWFGDAVVSYGLSDIDNESGGAFDVTSSTEASQTAFYFGGGKEYTDPEGSGALLRPQAGLQISMFDQDAYTEESTTAVGKDVAGFDRMSYLSSFGVELVIPQNSLKANYETQFRAFWLHEFNTDEEIVDYTLVGSNQPGQFVMRSPDRDVGQFGVGLVADCNKTGLKLRADLDTQFSKSFYSATVSGALLYEF
jgi:hypothetical protein